MSRAIKEDPFTRNCEGLLCLKVRGYEMGTVKRGLIGLFSIVFLLGGVTMIMPFGSEAEAKKAKHHKVNHNDLRADHEGLEGKQNMIKETLDVVEGNQAMTHEWLEKIEGQFNDRGLALTSLRRIEHRTHMRQC